MGDVSRHGLLSKWLLSLGFLLICVIYGLVLFLKDVLISGWRLDFFDIKNSDLWYRSEEDPEGQFMWD